MCQIQVLGAADLESNDWVERILTLDRLNMAQVLRESGRDFPELRRRSVLRDPSLVVIALVNREELIGYVDFCDDQRNRMDVYLTSIQLVPRYRRGLSIAKLLAPAARILKKRSFRYVRADVQRSNIAALTLCSRLGFRTRERADSQTSWDVIGDRTLLESEFVTKIMDRDAY